MCRRGEMEYAEVEDAYGRGTGIGKQMREVGKWGEGMT